MSALRIHRSYKGYDDNHKACRMVETAVRRVCSELNRSPYADPYGERLSDTRTSLAVFVPHPAGSH